MRLMGRFWPRLRWMLRSVRWPWIVGAAGLLAILPAAFLLDRFVSGHLGAGGSRLSILTALIGVLGTLVGVAAGVLAMRRDSRNAAVLKPMLLEPRLTTGDIFVDRRNEAAQLVAAMAEHPVTNVVGPKGSGKSHFLAYVADVLNGHRDAGRDPSALKQVSGFRLIYFDLADALGFQDAVRQLFDAHFPQRTASWEQFTTLVDHAFGRLPLILVLDNVNAEGISTELGRAVYRYLARRPRDRVVIGSIRPISFINLTTHHMPFSGFDEGAVGEFAAASAVSLRENEVAELHLRSHGLPLFLRLLFAHWDREQTVPGGVSTGVRHLLRDTILPRLTTDAAQLLVGIALLSVVNRDVSDADLRRLPVNNLDDRLDELSAYSLVLIRPRGGSNRMRVHDLVRDAAIELCDARVREMAHLLALDCIRRGMEKHAALLRLYAAPNGFDSTSAVQLLEKVIFQATDGKDYPFLTALSLIAATRGPMKQLCVTDQQLETMIVFAQSSALAGVGRYVEALDALHSSLPATLRKGWRSGAQLTPAEFELAYLEANLLHLLNRYDEALEAFYGLQEVARHPAFGSSAARVEWAVGHVLRHQGRDLQAALVNFDTAERISATRGDVPTRLLSLTGRLSIEIHLDQLKGQTCARLSDLDGLIQRMPRYENYLPKIWKSKSQIAFLEGRPEEAFALINRAIERALELNDRLLFNFRFERAEYHRLTGNHSAAEADYAYVLEAGEANQDRNLLANAILGLVENDLSSLTLLWHRNSAEMRASALRARSIAMEADIYVTARQAEETLLRLEGHHSAEARLILF